MSMTKGKWFLERKVVLSFGNKGDIETMVSRQFFSTKKMADVTRADEMTVIANAMKDCCGTRAERSRSDIIVIGSIIANRRDIVAVNFHVGFMTVVVGDDYDDNNEEDCDSDSTSSADDTIPNAVCTEDDDDD